MLSSCVTIVSRFMTRLFKATVGMAGIGVAAAPARRAVVCIGFSAKMLASRCCCAGDRIRASARLESSQRTRNGGSARMRLETHMVEQLELYRCLVVEEEEEEYECRT